MWSQTLIKQTREALNGEIIPRDDFVYFKNQDGRFGAIRYSDIVAERFSMTDRESGAISLFASADLLIEVGWALD